MSSDPLGHVIRTAHHARARESMTRFFRRPDDNEPDGEASEFVNLDAAATSPPMPQPLDGNAILRNAIEEAVGDKQMRRRYGR
jgi:hypothetical protein